MNIQTPLMIFQDICESAGVDYDTWKTGLVHGCLTMKGSATVLQDDFNTNALTPDTFTRNANNTPLITTAGTALTTGTFHDMAAASDFLTILVGKPDVSADHFQYVQSTPGLGVGFTAGYTESNGRCGVLQTDVSDVLQGTTGATGSKLSTATASNVHASITGVDANDTLISAGSNLGALFGAFYDLDTSSGHTDALGTGYITSAEANTTAGMTFPDTEVISSGVAELYGLLIFEFASNSLPDTTSVVADVTGYMPDAYAIAKAIAKYNA